MRCARECVCVYMSLVGISCIFVFNCRYTTTSSIRLETRARISSKSTCRAAKYSPKLCSIVRSRVPTLWKSKHVTEHHPPGLIAISSPIQVSRLTYTSHGLYFFFFAICFVVPLYRFLVIGCHIFGAPDATLLRCCIDYWRYRRSLYQPFCKGQVAVVFLATFYSLIPNKNVRYRVSYVWEFFFFVIRNIYTFHDELRCAYLTS